MIYIRLVRTVMIKVQLVFLIPQSQQYHFFLIVNNKQQHQWKVQKKKQHISQLMGLGIHLKPTSKSQQNE